MVVSDALAQQFGAPPRPSSSAQQPHQQQAGPGPGPSEEGDAELEALLQQLQIGSTGLSSLSGAGAAAARSTAAASGAGRTNGGHAGFGSLLASLGIGDADPRLPPPLAQQQEQQQLHAAAPPPSSPRALEPGVHILSAADYFGSCWGHVPAVADVFDSIQQSQAEAQQQQGQASSGGGFRPHPSLAGMEAGLASGALLAGTLCASRRVPGEATVNVGAGRQLLLSGRAALNRAVHGDRVAVRLLPREQWRPAAELAAAPAAAGAAGEEGGEAPDEHEHDLLATAGDGEADVAADEAREAAAGDGEPLDAVVSPALRLLPA